jgi:arylsulfatase A-like enzyme
MMARLNEGLAAKFGAGRWARLYSAAAVMLDDALIAKNGVDRRALEQEARRLLEKEQGVAAAFARGDIEGSSLPPNTPYLAQVRNTWHHERSADVQVVLKPWWLAESRRTYATTHGSAQPYDTNVPMLFWGPRWFGAGRVDGRVEVVDIAPTLAHFLEISPPAASEGKPLPLPRRER